MQLNNIQYIVNNISLPFNASVHEAFSVAIKRMQRLGVSTGGLAFSVYRRSVDARKKQDIRFVYSILVSGEMPVLPKEKLAAQDVSLDLRTQPCITFGENKISGRPVVVGSGPCGLFCALLLAENGYSPVLIERGGSVEERVAQVDRFNKERILDTDTNIQFGAGGAGTFSDGKLVTRINDSLSSYIIENLVKYGAPEEIATQAKPHVGTDILMRVVQNVIDRIVALGGEVMYHTTYLGMNCENGTVRSIKTNRGDIPCSDLVLAIGHSARETYDSLMNDQLDIEAKSFSVGMRIEHPTSLIDSGMYGDHAGDPLLGHAEYNLSYNTKVRGVYTFCMCPGGVVVAATSENGGVVSNGMSYHARDGKNSNSAVCCTVFKEDYGATPRDAIAFQRRIERAAFAAGGSDYSAPIITVGDFINGNLKALPTDVIPTYMNGEGVRLARPETYLPAFVTDNIKNALFDFDKKIHGFASSSAVLTGAETRTSAPVRILRNFESFTANGYTNLYPAGEGAGYAGGITSAAIDGVKTALKIMSKYRKQ